MGILLSSLVGLTLAAHVKGSGGANVYITELIKWRAEQTAELKRDEGFLSVAGLFWLKPGVNSVGSGAACDVKLPSSAPVDACSLTYSDGHVILEWNSQQAVKVLNAGDAGVAATSNGGMSCDLKLDSTRVSIGDLKFVVIKRGARVGVRLFDKNCPGYKEFKGQRWFAPDLRYVVAAKFVPYGSEKTIDITNVLGDTAPVPLAGYVEFTLDGKQCRLEAQGTSEGLFINFRDLTSGKETYPAGRFLDTPKPVDGHVTLDFNRATNPPCAFTGFATCPLAPIANYLPIAIPAGEKTHHPVGAV